MHPTIGSLRREALNLGLELGDELYVIWDGHARLRFAAETRAGRRDNLDHPEPRIIRIAPTD